MPKLPRHGLLPLALAATLMAAGTARAADPWYEDKVINFIVARSPGDGSDLGCRLLAQYLPKYLPGNPVIIVKNMPSADSISALNYVGKDARKDGLTLLCGIFGLDNGLNKSDTLQVALDRFDYVAGDGDPDVFYVRADVPPGVKAPADLFKAKGLVLGGSAVTGLKDIQERLTLEVLGLDDYKYVTGFTGAGAARAAIQQKFINIYMEASTGYLQVTVPTMVKGGDVVPLFTSGVIDANGNTVREDRTSDLPTVGEFYQAHYGKSPAGTAWDLYSAVRGALAVSAHALMLPPGSPQEAVDAMRNAIDPLNHDSDFIAASDKLRGAGTREVPGALVYEKVKAFLDMNQTLRDKYFATIKSGETLAQSRKQTSKTP